MERAVDTVLLADILFWCRVEVKAADHTLMLIRTATQPMQGRSVLLVLAALHHDPLQHRQGVLAGKPLPQLSCTVKSWEIAYEPCCAGASRARQTQSNRNETKSTGAIVVLGLIANTTAAVTNGIGLCQHPHCAMVSKVYGMGIVAIMFFCYERYTSSQHVQNCLSGVADLPDRRRRCVWC